ncbi:hypothetical protein CRYUN_Cryun02cG0114100 [Craigia yunnanensis]
MRLLVEEDLLANLGRTHFLGGERDSISAFFAASAPRELVSSLMDKYLDFNQFFRIWLFECLAILPFPLSVLFLVELANWYSLWSQVCCEVAFLFFFFSSLFKKLI